MWLLKKKERGLWICVALAWILVSVISVVLFVIQMLCGLLGLLVFWSMSSAMMPPHASTLQSNLDDFTPDPNTFWSSGDGEMSSIGHKLPAMFPLRDQPDNHNTDEPNKLRMLEARMLLGSSVFDQDICDMLLNPLAPVPAQQIPPYCFCSHCKGTVGPKGMHGDPGPSGKWTMSITLNLSHGINKWSQSINVMVMFYIC